MDAIGRPLRDLRISVTDRRNFRCVYCMPKEVCGRDFKFLDRSQILTFEEIARLAGVIAPELWPLGRRDPLRHFWILHLDEQSYRPTPEAEYAIQLLDESGDELAIEYLREPDQPILVGGESAAQGVVRAIRELPRGRGEYVTLEGTPLEPF